MKKSWLIAIVLLAACSNGPVLPDPGTPRYGLNISPTRVDSLKVGSSLHLFAQVTDITRQTAADNQSVIWSIHSGQGIVLVNSDGTVNGIKPGSAFVEAS